MKDIQNHINNNLNSLCKNLSVPQRKTIKETFNGIIRTKSCVLQEIFSETKNEKFSKKAERVIHLLQNIEITERTSEMLTKRMCLNLEKDTVIAFDEGDIAKPKSKKMWCFE